MSWFKVSDFWQSATMAAVLWSFFLANRGNPAAMHLWENGAGGIATLLGLGVGMKMAQRPVERWIEKRYPGQDISTGDGEP
jgi:hypothetical protein